MIVCFGACSATVYTVGGDEGWTSSGTVDYNEWTSSKLFHVGNEFIFNYKHEDDFVTLVTEVDYDHCISPSLALSDYGGLTTLTFNKPGTYYVICGEPGHCEAGQNIKIKINDAELENSISSPRPSPSPSSPSGSPFEARPPSSTQMMALILDLLMIGSAVTGLLVLVFVVSYFFYRLRLHGSRMQEKIPQVV
ncbi:blue copper protein-like [Pyrus ussuriensis x Pyrus communis]|uniref:Blue copper protein-like n=1 Tax=Pyrus ussuriensis x Pyrus communis TaxID=2448454 RepID=A0A5N5I772_9ROSA|nr:blue copper protein-like [Pyrus ussuriensis x Pyrus communis]